MRLLVLIHKRIQPETSLPKQQQITFIMTLSWRSAYHPKYCTIRGDSLKMTHLKYKMHHLVSPSNKWSQRKNEPNFSFNVAQVIYVYNCSRHGSTGYSPYYLMFGRKAQLPIDPILRSEIRLPTKMWPERVPAKLEQEDSRCFWSSTYKVYRKKRERYAKEVEVRNSWARW